MAEIDSFDAARELNKAVDILESVYKYLRLQSEANAALHVSDKVMQSPLAQKVETAIAAGKRIAEHWESLDDDLHEEEDDV